MAPVRTHLPRASLGLLALAGLLLTVLTLVPSTSGPLGARADAAAPPDAPPDGAVVSVYVGGDRTTSSTIGPLGGAEFGLFRTEPTSYDPDSGVTTNAPDYQCTSDTDGWCNITVPLGAGGIPVGSRLWVAPIAAPAGWYANPVWQTAPLSPTGQDPKVETRHIFETPALQQGRQYISTVTTDQFITDPGYPTTNSTYNAIPNYTRRIASGGVWPLSRDNPPMPAQCGIKVALVVDLSSSVSGYVGQLKDAMDAFVDSLRGTPSQVALFSFGTGSPANGYPNSNTGLQSVATTADADRFKSVYAGWGNPPTNYTNWDAGLNSVAAVNENPDPAQHFDLAVMITDGNPTVYGDVPNANTNNPTIPRNSGYTRFRELGNSVASANRVKAESTRVVAVGVGTGLDSGAARNLRSISGPVAYDGDNIADADYLQEASYDDAGAALRDLVLSQCAPSISVIKRIIPDGGTVAQAYTPSDGWDFTATTTTPGASVTPPATKTTDLQTGGTNFDVGVPADSPGTFQITETQKPDYTLYPVNQAGTGAGTQNATCVDKSSGTDVPVPVTNVGETGISIPVGVQGVVSCVVYNQAPDFTSASVLVHKRWRVTTAAGTVEYDNRTQPPDLEAGLHLDGPEGAPPTSQEWDQARSGYTGHDPVTDTPGDDVTVSEDVTITAPGCTLTSSTMAGTGIDGSIDLGTTAPATTVADISGGRNEWTITNSVECHSTLTLVKNVENGDASPDSWTLSALGPDSALTGPHGTTGVSSEVTEDQPYQIAESAPDDPDLLNYVQEDVRPRPVQWPLSTGSASCVVMVDGEPAPGDPMGGDGSVSVPLGDDVTCTVTNVTAPLTVAKRVVGGTAEPEDFRFTVVPVEPHPDGLRSYDIEGAAPVAATPVNVRPGQPYRISEVDGPPGYQLDSLQCTVGGRQPRSVDVTIPPRSEARCLAVNSYSRWTAEKSSDPPSGEVEPGTVITYTITARHLEGSATRDVSITDDLAEVLQHTSFVEGSLTTSAGEANRDGATVSWTIPELADSETLTFQVRVDDDASDVTIVNGLTSHTTARGDEAVDCEDVTTDATAAATAAARPVAARATPTCDQTVHEVPEQPTPPPSGPSTPSGPSGGNPPGSGSKTESVAELPDTGGPAASWLVGGAALVVLGCALVGTARLRRRR